jgi:hypothetical protein
MLAIIFIRGTPLPNISKSKPALKPVSGLFRLQQVVIFALAGLLIFYHTYMLFDLYVDSSTDLYGGPNANGHVLYAHTQPVLRLVIVFSLMFVILNKQFALVGMWFGIGALVATHYWAHYFDLPFPFVEGRHPLSYLKGFIIPSVLTLLHFSTNATSNRQSPASS